jgi:hypothetical protein
MGQGSLAHSFLVFIIEETSTSLVSTTGSKIVKVRREEKQKRRGKRGRRGCGKVHCGEVVVQYEGKANLRRKMCIPAGMLECLLAFFPM